MRRMAGAKLSVAGLNVRPYGREKREGKMKVVDDCRRVLRRAGVKLRGVWENWSRRKKVAVSASAVIGVLLLGAVIFCLTVPLFYWWPDGVPIPGTDGTMMFVKESDMNREYFNISTIGSGMIFPDAVDIYLADEHELEEYVYNYKEKTVDPPVFCMVTIMHERFFDYQLSTGEWLPGSIVEAEVMRDIFDVNHDVSEGERILVFTYNRNPVPSADGKIYTVDFALAQDDIWSLELRRTRSIDSFRQWFDEENPEAIIDNDSTLRDALAWVRIPENVSAYLNYPRWNVTRFKIRSDRVDRDYSFIESQQDKWIHIREGVNDD